MKFNTSIFCLLAIAHFSIFVSCTDDDDDLEEEPNFYTDRWKQELAVFKSGLKMANDEGELVELTLSNSTSAQLVTGRGSSIRKDVKFYLYTKLNQKTPQRLETNDVSLQNSNYDASKPTFFITHGWINNKDSEACTLIRDAYLRHKDGNVIVVDWSPLSVAFYDYSAYKVLRVGKRISTMIKFLQRTGFLSFDQTTLVGHSLGAHVMGIAGYRTQGRIQHVIGLDPALPFFQYASPGERISDEDGKYVEIIHTNAGVLGSHEALGHTDYFVNGGSLQPGCVLDLFGVCAHSRAYKIFAESIGSPQPFWALECNSALEFLIDLCVGPRLARLGVARRNPHDHGVFYLPTNGQSPFVIDNSAANYVNKYIGYRSVSVRLLGPE